MEILQFPKGASANKQQAGQKNITKQRGVFRVALELIVRVKGKARVHKRELKVSAEKALGIATSDVRRDWHKRR